MKFIFKFYFIGFAFIHYWARRWMEYTTIPLTHGSSLRHSLSSFVSPLMATNYIIYHWHFPSWIETLAFWAVIKLLPSEVEENKIIAKTHSIEKHGNKISSHWLMVFWGLHSHSIIAALLQKITRQTFVKVSPRNSMNFGSSEIKEKREKRGIVCTFAMLLIF